MRAVVQRCARAQVRVGGEPTATIGAGLLVLVAAGQGDKDSDADWLADKVVGLRIFPDEQDRMNRSLLDVGGQIIAVSQFTLYGNCRKGRRPSFVGALEPEAAARLVDRFVARVRENGLDCGTGSFGAHMEVELVNDGPVTLLIDSQTSRRSSKSTF